MQIVFKGSDYTDAHIVAGMLESEGIPAYVGGHYLQGGLGDIGVANLIDVRVDIKDINKAKEIIAVYEQQRLSDQKNKVNLSATTKKAPLKAAAIIFICVLFALMIMNL